MNKPRSMTTLMRGMTGTLLAVGATILTVGSWSFLALRASVDQVLAVDQVAVSVAQARAKLALDMGALTIADIPDSAWDDLAFHVAAAGLPEMYQRDAAFVVTQLHQPGSGDVGGRQSAAAALVDLQGVVDDRRTEVLAEQQRRAHTAALVLALIVGLGLVAVAAAVAWVRGSLLTRFRTMSSTARHIVDGADKRLDTTIHDPLGAVAAAFNAGLDKQAVLVSALENENRRAAISRQIGDGLELANGAESINEVIRRAMGVVVPGDVACELIITEEDDSRAIRSVAANLGGRCKVTDPNECAAMRRGAIQRFHDPEAINACPHLEGRDVGRATCLPATFLGQPLGVLHVVQTTDDVSPLDETMLTELASLAANRIGTMRAFAQEEVNGRTDPLTGLLNRRAFERSAARVADGVLAMADLDHFKMINDTFGHDAGDQALQVFTEVLTRTTRTSTDLVCRWGGEEFAILFPEADMATATEVIARIQELLARECLNHPPAFTSSWGLADLGGSLKTAIAAADRSLYEAKSNGRNCFVVSEHPSALTAPTPRREPVVAGRDDTVERT